MGRRQVEKKREQSLYEAATQGETAILKEILGKYPQILERVKMDRFVYTPLHVAASEGHLEFVRELLDNNKALARVLDNRRWSALHPGPYLRFGGPEAKCKNGPQIIE